MPTDWARERALEEPPSLEEQEFLNGIVEDDAKTEIMEGFEEVESSDGSSDGSSDVSSDGSSDGSSDVSLDGESFDDDWKATEAAAIDRDSHIQQTMVELGVSTKHEVYEQARRVIGVALVASAVAEPEAEEGIAVPAVSIHVEEEIAIAEQDDMPTHEEIDEVLDQIEAAEDEFQADAEAAFPVTLPGPPARRPQMSSEISESSETSDAEVLNGPISAHVEASAADVSAHRRSRRPRTPTRSPERRGRVSGLRVPSRRPPQRPDQRGRVTSPLRTRARSPVQ